MQFNDWEPIYESILEDLGFDRFEDESSVRVLKAVTMNSDLIMDDELESIIGRDVTVIGDSPSLEDDLRSKEIIGSIICSGSATGRLVSMGYNPDIVVTDLDGPMVPQIEACNRGAPTLIHAHGNNSEAILEYASVFRGPILLTTQSKPDNLTFNFGGFTDGDRAVCLARHFGAKRILLLGFDFDNPNPEHTSDIDMKLRKLQWAKKIIFDYNYSNCEIIH